MPQAVSFSVNGRHYAVPSAPVVVVCVDGCGDEYLSAALDRGRMPRTQAMSVAGYRGLVRGALPSFTNVNNAAIATGLPPSQTGISGNFFLDPETGEEVMMNSAKYLRCPTIFAAAAEAGRRVAIVTAKEKLRDILSYGMQGIAFSTEKARDAKLATHGIDQVETLVGAPTPAIYSPDASLYALRAGVAMLHNNLADFLYLSLTDYMQHTYGPYDAAALDFYAHIDHEMGRLHDAGAIVAWTADHGMNAKCRADGQPHVIYLESLLDDQFGVGSRVILPITDPYVAHHGALGSFATIHVPSEWERPTVAQWLDQLPGVTEVYSRDVAARKLELPADRIGDLVVLSARDVVLGRKPAYHDLSALHGTLRSHGGRYEEMVPMVLSRPLNPTYLARATADPRNFDIFDFACNGG